MLLGLGVLACSRFRISGTTISNSTTSRQVAPPSCAAEVRQTSPSYPLRQLGSRDTVNLGVGTETTWESGQLRAQRLGVNLNAPGALDAMPRDLFSQPCNARSSSLGHQHASQVNIEIHVAANMSNTHQNPLLAIAATAIAILVNLLRATVEMTT